VPALAEQLVSFLAPASLEAEQYRTLRQRVERLRSDAGLQVLAVTSPGAGDGKTVTVLNLAGSLAQAQDARILVIDGDLHRPRVGDYLGLADARTGGLAEAIQDPECGLARMVRRLDSLKISVLPPGRCGVAPYELLSSPRFEALLADARLTYDYVLIDTPPVVPVADCRLLGPCVDGFIVVVGANRTPRKMLGEALALLDPAKVIGVVLNGDERPLSAYYGYSGYYGQQHTPSNASARRQVWWRALRRGRHA
jgi:capsular exopolysaccharide synthesis family protein